MRFSYLTTVNGVYYYRCRVPADLLLKFPYPVIKKSLKTENKKEAATARSAIDYRTKKLFTELRSGMLDESLARQLIATYLMHGCKRIGATVTGADSVRINTVEAPLSEIFSEDTHLEFQSRRCYEALEESGLKGRGTSHVLQELNKQLKAALKVKNAEALPLDLKEVAKAIKSQTKTKLTKAEARRLGLGLIDAQIQLNEAEIASLDGNWSAFQNLQRLAVADLQKPYTDLRTLIKKFLDDYSINYPNRHRKTVNALVQQSSQLLEILGNISVDTFNRNDTLTELKRVLQKYPLNKQQRFGDKSVYKIPSSDVKDYISLTTANKTITTAGTLVEYAARERMLTTANVYTGKFAKFEIEENPDEERNPYDKADMVRLTDALCTEPLWYRKSDMRPERFWIVMVAIFTGLRPGNIVTLKKEQIQLVESKGKELWIMAIKKGKSKSTIRPVAIPEVLEVMGFIGWVDCQTKNNLFKDSVESWGAFWNRHEVRPDGSIIKGFEPRHITEDKKKCFYSLRHSFAGAAHEVSDNFKVVADLMGHSTAGSMTARYSKITKAARLKDTADKMEVDGLDIYRLWARAEELFPCLKNT